MRARRCHARRASGRPRPRESRRHGARPPPAPAEVEVPSSPAERGRSRAPRDGRARPGRRRPRSAPGRLKWMRGASIASSTRQPVVDDVDDDLEDRAAESDRARAADDEARDAVARARSTAPSCSSAARPAAPHPDRVEVVLAEHVVHVDAGARDDHAGAGAGRALSATPRCRARRRPRCASSRCTRSSGRLCIARARMRRSAARRFVVRVEPPRRARRGGGLDAKRPAARPQLLAHHLDELRDRLGAARAARRPRAGRGARARKPIRTPPDDGGGFDTNSWPLVRHADRPPPDHAVARRGRRGVIRPPFSAR